MPNDNVMYSNEIFWRSISATETNYLLHWTTEDILNFKLDMSVFQNSIIRKLNFLPLTRPSTAFLIFRSNEIKW